MLEKDKSNFLNYLNNFNNINNNDNTLSIQYKKILINNIKNNNFNKCKTYCYLRLKCLLLIVLLTNNKEYKKNNNNINFIIEFLQKYSININELCQEISDILNNHNNLDIDINIKIICIILLRIILQNMQQQTNGFETRLWESNSMLMTNLEKILIDIEKYYDNNNNNNNNSSLMFYSCHFLILMKSLKSINYPISLAKVGEHF